MNLAPTDLKKGVIFALEGQVYECLDYQQKVVGRQQSSVTIKARNLDTQKLYRHTFKGDEALQTVALTKLTVQFLYQDGGACHFMSPTDFGQYSLPHSTLTGKVSYLAEGENYILVLREQQPLTLELPKNVLLAVIQTATVVRGNTANTVLKEAKLVGGLTIKVPAFIKIGDLISVDTSNGTYRERRK